METTPHELPVALISEQANKIRTEIQKVIIGQDDAIELLLVALFTGGHVLIEGVPGIAKTLTARMLAKTLAVDFSRIQFTPDLMPADILGTMVYSIKREEFSFNRGPVFSNLVLIDEINRAPAKTQAALFEVMEERQVSMDGKTWPMKVPFMVVATQNPIEQEGTYKLPEAQLDRFLFRIKTTYPGLDDEKAILMRFREDFGQKTAETVSAVLHADELQGFMTIIEQIIIQDELLDYIARIIMETRQNRDLFLGASPRASLAVMKSAKALAAIRGRDFVTPDDIRFVMIHVLNHRIILSPEKEMEGAKPEDVINEIIARIEVPR
jgi:MoxR-like ATPase